MTHETSFLFTPASVGSRYKHAESRLSGNSLARFARLIGILLVSLFGAHTAAHAFGAIATGTLISGNLVAGASHNQPTPQAARMAAEADCDRIGRTQFITYQGNCAAVEGYAGQHLHGFFIAAFFQNIFYNINDTAAGAALFARLACQFTITNNPCVAIDTSSYPQIILEDTVTTCPAGMVLDDKGTTDPMEPAHSLDDTCEAIPCTGGREALNNQCLCPEGQMGTTTNGDPCTPCGTGQFSNADRTTCELCPVGQVLSGSSCMRCEGDLMANRTQTLCVCSTGQERVAGGNTCRACDSDQIGDGLLSCQECGAGQQANEDNSMCEACPDGMVSAGDGDCVPCSAATGMPNPAKTQCVLDCDDGSMRTVGQACEEDCTAAFEDYDAGTKTCTPCTGNSYFNNGACEACPVSSSPSADRSACECVAGHAKTNGTTCQRCVDGEGVNDQKECAPCASGLFSNDDGICRPCPAGQGPNNARTECVTQNQCDDGTTARPSFSEMCEEACSQVFKDYNSVTKSCVDCADDQVFNGTSCVGCPDDKMPNSEDSFCVCPAGERNYPTMDGEICADSTLPEYPAETADTYNDDSCRSQGWSVVYDIDSQMRVAELCEIRVAVDPSTSASALSETVVGLPLQLTPGSEHDACLMRAVEGYAGSFLSCSTLFGEPSTRDASNLRGVFPDASQHAETPRVQIEILPNGQPQVRLPLPPEDTGASGDDGGSSSDTSTILFGGVAAVVLYSWLLSDGGVESLSLQPQAEVRHNDNGSYYAYGSRLGFAANNWSGYWETLQTRSGGRTGNWISGAGTEWTGDVFSASLENTTQGYDSDTAFSVSAKKQWGNWTLESSYVSDLRIRDVLNTTWRNRLGVGANAVYNKWTLTPRVEFSWQDSELPDDEVRFRMNVLREF